MDWEPTLSNSRQRRAKWVDEVEMKKRREEKRSISLLRLARTTSFLRYCIFLPAQRPPKEGPRVQKSQQIFGECRAGGRGKSLAPGENHRQEQTGKGVVTEFNAVKKKKKWTSFRTFSHPHRGGSMYIMPLH